MDVIRTESLTKSFGTLCAVDRVTFSISRGEIFGLVGPDGAGKTTTMRLLTAIMLPSSGEAWVSGHHIVKEAEVLKEEIGYMSQQFGLYNDLTIMENIHFYADIYGVSQKKRRDKIEELLSFSNLTPFKKRRAGNLSGGMKQKLGLVCALIHKPKILFLDEPTNGVDPLSRREFWRILYQLLREKVTIFVSTAYLDEAERCNRVGLIHKGNLLAIGTPGDVKKLMKGTILEIRTTAPRQVTDVLRQKIGGLSVNLFGDKVHVVTTEPEKTTRAVQKILREKSLEMSDIRQVEPALEDVFVSVLAEKKEPTPNGKI